LLGIMEDDGGVRSFLSLALLSWEVNIWKGTYTRIHPYKIAFSIHGFYTPSNPLKSYLTTQELPSLFIQLYDYLTRKYLAPEKSRLLRRQKTVSIKPVNAAWVPGMDDLSTYIRSELAKTYPNVPRASTLGRRTQKKVGRRKFVLNLVDTLSLRPVGNGTMIGQDFILEFDLGRVTIPLARNTTFNIVAFIVNETYRSLSVLEKEEITPGIEKYLTENRFKCQWCGYGAAAITKIDTDPKFPYPVPVFEALITCPKCHEKSLAIFSSKESGIQQDAHHRLLICEKCGKEGLQIIGRKAGFGRKLQVKAHCPSCGNDALRNLLRSFPL
jgi:Zn finger protein HypA/HybF involved in hydrogenase expression